MKNEKDFKLLFRKSVTAQKGYTIPLAAPMFAGIPDLFVVMPNYMPIMLEAKWLGEIKRDDFTRKIPFTPLQILWIERCHNVLDFSAMGLIGFIYQKEIFAVLVAHGTSMFNSFTHNFVVECAYTRKNSGTKLFDVVHLFARVPIPHIGDIKETISDTTGSSSPLAV